MDFAEIKEKVKALNLPDGKYALFGSVPLAAHGIRESNDIDILVAPDVYARLKGTPGWEAKVKPNGNAYLGKGDIEVFEDWQKIGSYIPNPKRLIEEADMIEGMPVITLKDIVEWKKAFGREKDLEDVRLVEEFLAGRAK